MEVKQVLEQIQQQYKAWKQERDQEQTITDLMDIQNFLASYMYDYAHKFVNDKDSLQTFVNGLYGLEISFEYECSLDRFKRIYDNVSALKEPIRTKKLVQLMNAMESFYKIPMMNNEEYNKNNPHIIQLYREISAARDL